MKIRLLFATLLIFFAAGSKAQITVDIFINGIKSGQYIVKEGDTGVAGIWYKKAVYKSMDKFSIQIKGKTIKSDVYRKSVEAVDDASNSLMLSPETPGVLGQFDLSDKSVRKRLGKGKIVKLYLQLDPANPTAKFPSKRIFIGNLTAK